MPISRITPMSAIQGYMQEQIEKKEQKAIKFLSYSGESGVNEARIAGNYKDQTGNLRSSIGYVVTNNGEIVQISSFDQVKSGNEGSNKGASFAKHIASKNTGWLSLNVVAGMPYSKYVSAKGYNVLDSSENLVERLVHQLMKQL